MLFFGIGFLSFIFSIVYYLLEAPSRSKFVKERNQYLKKLEDVIKASSDYEDFTRFYKIIEFVETNIQETETTFAVNKNIYNLFGREIELRKKLKLL